MCLLYTGHRHVGRASPGERRTCSAAQVLQVLQARRARGASGTRARTPSSTTQWDPCGMHACMLSDHVYALAVPTAGRQTLARDRREERAARPVLFPQQEAPREARNDPGRPVARKGLPELPGVAPRNNIISVPEYQ